MLDSHIVDFGIRKYIFTAETQRAQRKTTEAIFPFKILAYFAVRKNSIADFAERVF